MLFCMCVIRASIENQYVCNRKTFLLVLTDRLESENYGVWTGKRFM